DNQGREADFRHVTLIMTSNAGAREMSAQGIGFGAGRAGDGSKEIECDTVCLAIGLVPNIELLYWTGCDIQFDPHRGGFIPSVDEKMHTTHRGIFVAGDAAAFTEEGFVDPELAGTQGRIAAVSAAEHLGAIDAEKAGTLRRELPAPTSSKGQDAAQYWQAWLDSIEASAKSDAPVCICEKVTRRDLRSMMERGPTHPDHVKRLTRAGMGYCQGRRCREQIQLLTSQFTSQQSEEIPLASYRPPFRPLPLAVIQNRDLAPEEEEILFGEYQRRIREEYLQATGASD
ncbi:MAG: FAD-dependent oxidoreductase, partial [Dehalococcoidia bacterium]